MAKKKPYTPNSQIKSALHRLFLRSRERAATVKRDDYTCQICKVRQSKARGREFKVQCHHINGVEWSDMIRYIRDHLLVDPGEMVTLCKKCHLKEHREVD